MNFRIGTGFDIHELISGSMIKLAGVSIPSKKMIDLEVPTTIYPALIKADMIECPMPRLAPVISTILLSTVILNQFLKLHYNPKDYKI